MPRPDGGSTHSSRWANRCRPEAQTYARKADGQPRCWPTDGLFGQKSILADLLYRVIYLCRTIQRPGRI
ncbi:MAG: hypothetical protein A2V70_10975 [Planctomycetes bacterium RBG_13_63_9]|nr:MAG: hypothetical protein A2V70_10975 [Planctomycetes bacterium RBG_13_63_9]